MLNNNDFKSCREVKWCPGCGNYSILKSMQKALELNEKKKTDVVFISGIGCSGRFPYYIDSHGFHTLHGRSSTIATGLRMVKPNLDIWVVLGDGDGFSIGLSHVLHMVRRNLNLNILFINNRIYALTKGQYSPTSIIGTTTKSSPYGSVETSINPLSLVLNAGATFIARSLDVDSKNLVDIFSKAMAHNGISFIEVLQNCNVYNNGIYSKLNDSEKFNNVLYLENNKEFLFGKNNEKKIIINKNMDTEIIEKTNMDFNNYNIKHNIYVNNILQNILVNIDYNSILMPFPLGIFKSVKKETYEELYQKNIINIDNNKKHDTLDSFLSSF
jgi:2-oxoglutarate/2-oxoacid ferredoxin oxidoreductase subunit beta